MGIFGETGPSESEATVRSWNGRVAIPDSPVFRCDQTDRFIIDVIFATKIVNFIGVGYFNGEECVPVIFYHFGFFIWDKCNFIIFDISFFAGVIDKRSHFSNKVLIFDNSPLSHTEYPVDTLIEVIGPVFFS